VEAGEEQGHAADAPSPSSSTSSLQWLSLLHLNLRPLVSLTASFS
jgi:hypothetical protein